MKQKIQWHEYLRVDKSCRDNYNIVVAQFPDVSFHAVKKALQRLKKKRAPTINYNVESPSISYNEWYNSYYHSECVIPDDWTQRYSYIEETTKNSRLTR